MGPTWLHWRHRGVSWPADGHQYKPFALHTSTCGFRNASNAHQTSHLRRNVRPPNTNATRVTKSNDVAPKGALLLPPNRSRSSNSPQSNSINHCVDCAVMTGDPSTESWPLFHHIGVIALPLFYKSSGWILRDSCQGFTAVRQILANPDVLHRRGCSKILGIKRERGRGEGGFFSGSWSMLPPPRILPRIPKILLGIVHPCPHSCLLGILRDSLEFFGILRDSFGFSEEESLGKRSAMLSGIVGAFRR